jgi:hypothetical protein
MEPPSKTTLVTGTPLNASSDVGGTFAKPEVDFNPFINPKVLERQGTETMGRSESELSPEIQDHFWLHLNFIDPVIKETPSLPTLSDLFAYDSDTCKAMFQTVEDYWGLIEAVDLIMCSMNELKTLAETDLVDPTPTFYRQVYRSMNQHFLTSTNIYEFIQNTQRLCGRKIPLVFLSRSSFTKCRFLVPFKSGVVNSNNNGGSSKGVFARFFELYRNFDETNSAYTTAFDKCLETIRKASRFEYELTLGVILRRQKQDREALPFLVHALSACLIPKVTVHLSDIQSGKILREIQQACRRLDLPELRDLKCAISKISDAMAFTRSFLVNEFARRNTNNYTYHHGLLGPCTSLAVAYSELGWYDAAERIFLFVLAGAGLPGTGTALQAKERVSLYLFYCMHHERQQCWHEAFESLAFAYVDLIEFWETIAIPGDEGSLTKLSAKRAQNLQRAVSSLEFDAEMSDRDKLALENGMRGVLELVEIFRTLVAANPTTRLEASSKVDLNFNETWSVMSTGSRRYGTTYTDCSMSVTSFNYSALFS